MNTLILKAAMFLSALLLFILQPLYAKHLLPYFGGAAAVWTVTMFFFTCVLCVGYLYATWLMKDGARSRLALHATLALIAVLFVLYSWWRVGVPLLTPGVATSVPGVGVFLTLLSGVFFPVLLLASSAVVVQKLYSWSTGENPYPLYALSNAGSLLGLLLYPFILEQWFDSHAVIVVWSVGFLLYCGLLFSAFAAVRTRAPELLETPTAPARREEVSVWTRREQGVVFILSAVPAFILVAATEYVNQAVAGLPLLWVAPLALYLISFMVAYRDSAARLSPLFAVLVGAMSIVTISVLLNPLAITGGMLIKGLVAAAGFLLICIWFHRQLYERRPSTSHLGQYYTLVTVGGVAGSVVVTFVLPLILSSRPELLVSVVLVALYGLWCGRVVLVQYLGRRVAVGVVLASIVIILVQSSVALGTGAVARERNFYGVLRVTDTATEIDGEVVPMRTLVSGSTLHGAEALDTQFQDRLLSYYSPSSGVGILLQSLTDAKQQPRVAAVGLGVGVLNYYCDGLSALDYIEINPAVLTLAQEHFSFLQRCQDKSGVIIGDGRTVIEEWSKQRREYDVIVIDAFTDDAIPLHLLTTEAFSRAYLPLLTDTGVLAFHVTNRHLALTPVVAGAAKAQGLSVVEVRSDDTSAGERAYRTIWVLVGSAEALRPIVDRGYEWYDGKTITWTDTKSSVLQVVKF
jgi:spermidine synthase